MSLNDSLNTVKDLPEKGLASMTSLTDLSLGIYDRLAAKQLAALDLLLEHGNDTLAHAVTAKDVQTFLKGQFDSSQDLTRLVMAESRTTLAMASQAHHEYQTWFKRQLAEVTNDLQRAVPAI
ncbi:MAG TPA: phasin family protein [Chromatiaceae bacterium]|nr:phasin family protein [Chromatiaceae bacterium]